MAYRFQKTELVAAGVRRITRERIDKALKHLSAQGDELGEGIHQARKRFKEIRAVLRLAKHGLGDRFTVENRCYRDLGRALSEARDAQVAIETWDRLCARFPDAIEQADARAVRDRLSARHQDLIAGRSTGRVVLDHVVGVLSAARDAIAGWPLEYTEFALIQQGLVEYYAKGRRGLHRAYADPTDKHFHEWRKRIKDQWYHTTLLTPAWEDGLGVRKRSLKALSDLVGDDHDLAMFKELSIREPQVFGNQQLQEQVLSLGKAQQRELRTQAYGLGSLLYAEKPKPFGRRMAAYWAVWRSQETG